MFRSDPRHGLHLAVVPAAILPALAAGAAVGMGRTLAGLEPGPQGILALLPGRARSSARGAAR